MEEIKVLFGETPILEGYSVEELLGMKPVLLVVLTPDGREYVKQVSPVTGMESWNGPLYAETVEEPLKPFKDEGKYMLVPAKVTPSKYLANISREP